MAAVILNGKKLAREIRSRLKKEIIALQQNNKRTPGLAVVMIGDDPASQAYVKNKEKMCLKCGIYSEKIILPSNVDEKTVLSTIESLNSNPKIDGILLQLPIPEHLNKNKILNSISPSKDVDGFTYVNMGKLIYDSEEAFFPCTPKGIITLLHAYDIDLTGKNAVILGRSTIVGKPLALLLLKENATVTVCHSRSDLQKHLPKADIVISAIGKPAFIKGDLIKESAIVVDVGINVVNGKIVGDIDWESVYPKASFITPVPGGVGPMTIASLLENTLKAYKLKGEN